ncbi:MAG: FG-GAP-like repeat-containing protein, partial [Planctomycetaceae bacterium]
MQKLERLLILTCAFSFAAGTIAVLRPAVLASPQQKLLRQAARANSDALHVMARSAAELVLRTTPDDPEALLIAGLADCQFSEHRTALDRFARIPVERSSVSVAALYHSGRSLMRLGRASDAEASFRKALALNPLHVDTNIELSSLLHLQGRTWEALPLVERLFRLHVTDGRQVLKSASIDGTFAVDRQFTSRCLKTVPEDPLPLLAQARRDLLKNRVPRAEAALRRIVAVYPNLVEAQVRLGRILLDTHPEEFSAWHSTLPDQADEHPELWALRGLWAERTRQPTSAVRCYLEALTRFPDHQESNARLAQVLGQLGHSESAAEFGARARDNAQMVYLSSELAGSPDGEMIRECAEIMLRSGRFWDSAGWCNTQLRFVPDEQWARAILKQSCSQLRGDSPLCSPDYQPTAALRISDYPLPTWTARATDRQLPPDAAATEHTLQFSDIAAASGLKFQYHNGTTASTGLEHMLQSTGGGIGVFDYDNDHWPDLLFAQSGEWPPQTGQRRYLDRLFRNSGTGLAEDVTDVAYVGDAEYSQGVTCGDFNDDGFTDLFVCNAGSNCLYENNGDGTFTDVTAAAGVTDSCWTLSAVFADLDGDGYPDLYVVNYLVLGEVVEEVCKRNGHLMGCAPTMFTSEQDQVYLNNGDGTFRNTTRESGIIVPHGKGLGVVAADFNGSGTIDLFVGNDTTANLFFINESQPGTVRLREAAAASGLAFDEGGNAQSCMGIASGDVDGDTLPDLFVTNFYGDSNTIYRQSDAGLFQDATRDSNLRDAGYNMLGFGAQFFDADLDGWLDLVVTNGHVDRTFVTGVA